MKKIISVIAEELIFSLPVIWVFYSHPEYSALGVSPWLIVAVFAAAAAVSKGVEAVIGHVLEKNAKGSGRGIRVKIALLSFIPVLSVFILALRVLEFVGKAPASSDLLLIMSFLGAASHTALSFLLDAALTVKRSDFSPSGYESDGPEE